MASLNTVSNRLISSHLPRFEAGRSASARRAREDSWRIPLPRPRRVTFAPEREPGFFGAMDDRPEPDDARLHWKGINLATRPKARPADSAGPLPLQRRGQTARGHAS